MVEWSGILTTVGYVLVMSRGSGGLVWILLADFAILATTHLPPLVAIPDLLNDYVVIFVSTWVSHRLVRPGLSLHWASTFRRTTLAFLAGATLGTFAPLVMSRIGSALFGQAPVEIGPVDLITDGFHTFFAMLLIVPMILIGSAARPGEMSASLRTYGVEFIAWMVTAVFLLWGLFSGMLALETSASRMMGESLNEYLPLVSLLLPTLLWAAVRFPKNLHSLALLMILISFYAGADLGLGPFAIIPAIYRKLYVAMYCGVFAFVGQFVNGLICEARATRGRLEVDVRSRLRELAHSEALLSSVIENIPDIILVKDARTLEWVRLNRAAETFLGVERDQTRGKTDGDLLPFEVAEANRKRDRDVLELADSQSDQARGGGGRGAIEVSEGYCLRRAGEGLAPRLFQTTRIPLPDESGKAEYLVVISEDITESRKAEQDRVRLAEEQAARREAEKLLELRDSFMSLVAHELRTPISVIKLSLEIALRAIPAGRIRTNGEEERLRVLFQKSIQEVDRLSRLVENLLDVSRVEADRFEVHRDQGVDLSALVKDVVEVVRPLLAQARSELVLNIADRVIADVDPDRIRQVFTNLLTNASKFGEGKPVSVALSSDGREWIATVEDQGIGISTEAVARIFERFERAVSYREFPGLGIGLYIASRIIQAHGGEIEVRSRPREGSRFILRVPLRGIAAGAA